MLSWYVTTASLGLAVGTEVSERVVDFLQYVEGWTLIDAYHTVFWGARVMGTLTAVSMLLLSANCEAEKDPGTRGSEMLLEEGGPKDDENDNEGEDLQAAVGQEPQTPRRPRSWLNSPRNSFGHVQALISPYCRFPC